MTSPKSEAESPWGVSIRQTGAEACMHAFRWVVCKVFPGRIISALPACRGMRRSSRALLGRRPPRRAPAGRRPGRTGACASAWRPTPTQRCACAGPCHLLPGQAYIGAPTQQAKCSCQSACDTRTIVMHISSLQAPGHGRLWLLHSIGWLDVLKLTEQLAGTLPSPRPCVKSEQPMPQVSMRCRCPCR